jgi:hypothetical protein
MPAGARSVSYTVEGRIGGRWWVWQRFATHDAAAAEIARLARERRFDGARLIETVPGANGAPADSRTLFTLDPDGPPAVDLAAATAAPPAAADETADALIAAPVADAIARALARVAAHAAAARAAMPAALPPAVPGTPDLDQPLAPASPPGGAPVSGEPPRDAAAATPLAAEAASTPAEPRGEAERLWEAMAAPTRRLHVPANDDPLRAGLPLPGLAIADDDDRVAAIPRAGQWRFRLRRVAYTLGAGAASLLLAVASYEATRLAIGLPDLLGEAHHAAAALLAGPERPLVAAARRGDAREVTLLLRGGASPNSEDPHGVPALLVSARAGHAGIVQILLDAGADPNRRFGANDTPLLAAAREGLGVPVELMLARGGQVNGRAGSDDCDTPLLAAANAGRLEMVNLLLARGASFEAAPGCRRGPLDAAAAHPRVRDALEAAYQRRLAGAPRAIPAALPAEAPAAPGTGDQPPDLRGYATLMYGFSWRDTLDEVKARARECRAVGRRYVACELAVKPLFDDAPLVEAWFDRGDGDRLVSIETRSIELVDYTAQRDGAAIRQRFDQVRREIERHLPAAPRPFVQRSAPTTLPFFEALKPEVAAGEYVAFWSHDGRRLPASIHLKLSGIDARKGFYRIVVSNPQRQSQQAAAP